jgi:hypothetical protein
LYSLRFSDFPASAGALSLKQVTCQSPHAWPPL